MRRLKRPDLSTRTLGFLAKRTAAVASASNPREASDQLWALRKNAAFDEIREKLATMASGRQRCMYCEDSQATAIDHFCPRALAPTSSFVWTNLLFACAHCNSNEKRDQFPRDGGGHALLVDPTAEDPFDHFDFVPETGAFVERTE